MPDGKTVRLMVAAIALVAGGRYWALERFSSGMNQGSSNSVPAEKIQPLESEAQYYNRRLDDLIPKVSKAAQAFIKFGDEMAANKAIRKSKAWIQGKNESKRVVLQLVNESVV